MTQNERDKLNCTQVKLKLNNKKDADILLKLEIEPNKQGYIKSLIRADIQSKLITTTEF